MYQEKDSKVKKITLNLSASILLISGTALLLIFITLLALICGSSYTYASQVYSYDTSTQDSSTIFDLGSAHLASLRSGDQYAQSESDSLFLSDSVWVRTFGDLQEQNSTNISINSSTQTSGFAIGSDTIFGESMRIGSYITCAYTEDESDDYNLSSTQNSIDTYHLTAYVDYTKDNYSIEGMLGLALGNNETSETSTELESTSALDSYSWNARIVASMPLAMSDSTYITPNSSLTQTQTQDNLNSFEAVVDIKVHSIMSIDKHDYTPSFYLGVKYEDEESDESAFTIMTLDGFPPPPSIDNTTSVAAIYGTSVALNISEWDLSAQYDGSMSTGTLSHTVLLQASYTF